MSLSRRHLFGLLAGAAVAPMAKPVRVIINTPPTSLMGKAGGFASGGFVTSDDVRKMIGIARATILEPTELFLPARTYDALAREIGAEGAAAHATRLELRPIDA